MDGPRIGSLFSGYGGLDAAVEAVTGGRTVWHSEIDPGAAAILAHQYPQLPNLGDITTVDWDTVPPVDVLCGGFPCQDVSAAGRQAGLRPGTRSGLWSYFAAAIDRLRPRLVVIENVRGLLSAEAHHPGHVDLGLCVGCLDGQQERNLRALGAVLGDLADLGFDAEWQGVLASEAGAPHQRFRTFVIAWPAAAHPGVEAEGLWAGLRQGDAAGIRWGRPDHDDPQELGAHGGHAGAGGTGRGGDAQAAADASGAGRGRQPRPDLEYDGPQPAHPGALGRSAVEAAADPDGREPERRGVPGVVGGPAAAEPGEGDQRERAGHPAGDGRAVAADPGSCGLDGRQGVLGTGRGQAVGVEAGDHAGDGRGAPVDWGAYLTAVQRWEGLTRPAPAPTEVGTKGQPRLNPRFVEWMMGLPDGWVTAVPGLTRNQMLKALGNGVVPQQAAHALNILLSRTADLAV